MAQLARDAPYCKKTPAQAQQGDKPMSEALPASPPSSIRTTASSRFPYCRRSRTRNAPACTACRRCSSPLDHPRFAEFDLSTLRTGIMAGSPCPTEVMKRVVSDMHLGQITIAYGVNYLALKGGA
jgi:hypothetical protein